MVDIFMLFFSLAILGVVYYVLSLLLCNGKNDMENYWASAFILFFWTISMLSFLKSIIAILK